MNTHAVSIFSIGTTVADLYGATVPIVGIEEGGAYQTLLIETQKLQVLKDRIVVAQYSTDLKISICLIGRGESLSVR